MLKQRGCDMWVCRCSMCVCAVPQQGITSGMLRALRSCSIGDWSLSKHTHLHTSTRAHTLLYIHVKLNPKKQNKTKNLHVWKILSQPFKAWKLIINMRKMNMHNDYTPVALIKEKAWRAKAVLLWVCAGVCEGEGGKSVCVCVPLPLISV